MEKYSEKHAIEWLMVGLKNQSKNQIPILMQRIHYNINVLSLQKVKTCDHSS